MALLRSTIVPRVLLGVLGVLLLLLAAANVTTIVAVGPTPDSLFTSVFAALLACVCFLAATGIAKVFTAD